MAEVIRITEVGPRDGLQHEEAIIAIDEKVRLIELLTRTGADEIEVTSFVSPKWAPQLGDAEAVLEGIQYLKRADVLFSALVPNDKGMDAALAVNEAAGFGLLDKIAVFTAASETFSRKNTNASIEETIKRFSSVVKRAQQEGLQLRGYISCAIACPFEGAIAPAQVAAVAKKLFGLGIGEIDIGDTIGAGAPASITAVIEAVRAAVPEAQLTLHLHDTAGAAAGCVSAALEAGIRSFDGAAAGLGGCPYASTRAKRAPGNIATAKLKETIETAGYATKIDDEALMFAERYALQIIEEARENAR